MTDEPGRDLPGADHSPDPSPPGARRAPGGPSPASDGGNGAEFEAFYRRFVPVLVGFLLCHGAPLALAADIAQSTMLKAWRSWPRISSPEAWARKTAGRELIRCQTSDRETSTELVPAGALLPHHAKEIAEFEARHLIIWMLGRLPPRQRQVMAWTIHGFEPREIATELGITPEAVRSSLKQARREVARMLNGEGEDHDDDR